MSVRRLRVLLPAALLAAACGAATGPTQATEGVPFTLAPGAVALVEPGTLLVGFVGVTADSRCPADVTCVVAGDAAAEVWVRRPPEPRLTRTLHTDPTLGGTAEVFGRELRLVDLQPQPLAARPVDPADYRATLEVR